jgi:hypothetical protein
MRFPVINARDENRSENSVCAHPAVKSVDQTPDHILIDAGLSPIVDKRRTSCLGISNQLIIAQVA